MVKCFTAVAVLSLFLFSPASNAQGPIDPGTPDATWARLVGRVLDGSTEQPSPNIPVLLQCNWLDGRFGRLRATTDTTGRFAIDTPAGRCTLIVNVPYGLSAETTGHPVFEFAPGETFETVRRLRSFPSAKTIEGQLLDERGEAVAGARVILRPHTLRLGARQWVEPEGRPTETDATGAFRLEAIGLPGTWEVVVPALGLSRLVEISDNATSTPLQPVVMRGASMRAFRVSGRVETPAGRSRSFPTIYLDRADSTMTSPLTIAQTSSDAAGDFTFERVPVGSYRLRIDTTPSSWPARRGAEIFWALTPIVVTGDVTSALLDAQPAPELRAEVRLDDQPAGSVPDRNLLLSIDAAGGKYGALITAPGGRLVTRGLFPEHYRVRASGVPTGYRVKSVTVGGRDVTVEGFDLRNGPIGDMIITLTTRLSEVSGVVRDGQERPDGDAIVVAFPTNRRLWTETGIGPAFIVSSNATQKGNYSIKALPPGEYFIVATTSDPVLFLTPDAELLGRLAPLAQRIRVADAESMTVNLRTRD